MHKFRLLRLTVLFLLLWLNVAVLEACQDWLTMGFSMASVALLLVALEHQARPWLKN